MNALTRTFEMNGKRYRTDSEILGWLRSFVPQARKTGDSSAVIALMFLGESGGRIVEIKPAEQN